MSDFDFSELDRFDESLAAGNRRLARNVETAVRVSALKGKRVWSRSASGRRYLGSYPSSIQFDPVSNLGGVIETELGPTPGDGSAGLGIVEDSPGGVRGAPQRHYEKAERIIEKDLEAGLLRALDQALGGA